ncbi:MAG: hypothetical protein HDR27_08745 [Lachnospiraceae bacterium]|nr:hypothetical protein [Lachnospiraceae bacterium]
MLSIQSNLLAMNANNFFQINSKKNKRTTEKLSSGYRINRSADDAAGLAISEKMRRQIRGLIQGTANAQDGISFVQVADGSMDEVHDMLQRMNELAIKSLNGTWTESDRAAMNAEFDQLRTEIDRINNETQYNEQPVFEEHESSYYQISGNKRWNDNQLHTVPALANELNIHLPDYYEPKDYTLTVPAGIYTTQELIDEIDSALERMIPPNPGFVFEYTDNGICKLNFESASGMPTEIASVDGSLSYLLFDSYNGSSSTSLLGTTVFDARYPLSIVKGQNDELGFYIEGPSGTNYVSMTIPAGKYSRSQMIDLINHNLAGNSDAIGVTAKEYGSSGIQITGGDTISITGLKGNMFKLDTTSIKYSSVFYDNVMYGSSTGGTAASITGRAYWDYNSNPITDKIYLSASNNNNVLRFKLNGAADYIEITFQEKTGGYTIPEIAKEINEQLDKLREQGLVIDAVASTGTTSITVPASPTSNTSHGAYYLKLSSTLSGTGSSLEFDTTAGSVYVNTYNALFRDTNYFPSSFSGNKAALQGAANLNGKITLTNDASFTFYIDNQAYTIKNLKENYADRNALLADLNNYIKNDPSFSAVKDDIEFSTYSSGIAINAKTDDIKKIDFNDADKNSTYQKLFVGTTQVTNSASYPPTTSGSVNRPQGSTIVNTTPATASVTIPSDKATWPITLDKDTNCLEFYLQGNSNSGHQTITLSNGSYSNMSALIAEINKQIAAKGNKDNNPLLKATRASFQDGKLTLTTTPTTDMADGTYSVSLYSSSLWRPLLGTHTATANPTVKEADKYTLRTYTAIPDSTTLNSSNNTLSLTVGSDSATINIAAGPYTSRESLKDAVQQAINKNDILKDKVTVDLTKDGKLVFNASGAISASGSFYKEVVITDIRGSESVTQKGTYTNSDYRDAYIIGRKDLTEEPVEITSGANDIFTFDFTYTAPKEADSYKKEISVKIPEGIYSGEEIAKILQEKIQEKFDEENLVDFDISVSIGGHQTDVVGSIDDVALQIDVKRKAGQEPAAGQYVLDGVRGSAASFLFYKTTNKPKATYITGSKDLSKGILFKPGQNVLTLSADSIPYQYTFPTDRKYTANEFVSLLNDMFENGDDNGNSAPLNASIENGNLKISHKVIGSHTITDIGGSARSTLFLEESGRNFRDPIYLLVGVETKNMVEIPRTRVSSCSLGINSITISKPKYAEKAVNRIKEAITMVSSRRSTYGSMQNRLEHTINNNNNVIENTQASESAIRDADIASEVMEHAKNSFLMQASQTILAQANQMPNLVLNLLQS